MQRPNSGMDLPPTSRKLGGMIRRLVGLFFRTPTPALRRRRRPSKLRYEVAPSGGVSRSPILKPPAYLQVQGCEYGPLDEPAIRRFLAQNEKGDQVYVWCRGLTIWTPVQNLRGYENFLFAKSQMSSLERDFAESPLLPSENRRGIRKSIAATARIYGSDKGNGFGICLDLSITGMQVRLEQNGKWRKDDVIEFNVYPISLCGIPPFRGLGKIAWVRERDHRVGVLFRSFEGAGRDHLIRGL
jgi:hypothetical protein